MKRFLPIFVVIVLFCLLYRETLQADAPVVPERPPATATRAPVVKLPTPKLAPAAKKTPRPDTTVAVSWMDLQRFLAADHTNWNKYVPGKYECVDFSCDLLRNARAAGLRSRLIGVDFKDAAEGHAFVSFETTDKGWVWIEPQIDYAYMPAKVGDRLCLVVDRSACMPGRISKIDASERLAQLICNSYGETP